MTRLRLVRLLLALGSRIPGCLAGRPDHFLPEPVRVQFRLRAIFAALFVLLGILGSSPIAAQTSDASSRRASSPIPIDEQDRWVPSIGIFGGFQQQSAEASVDPGMLNPTAPQCTAAIPACQIDRQIQPFDEGDDELRLFRAGFTAEVMTPRFSKHPAAPRAFVHIDPILATGFERNTAGTGNPGPMIEGELAADARRSDAQAFSGQGSRVLAEVSPFVLGVGVGLAFTVDLLDQRFRIKPSIEYIRERLNITGKVNRVVQVAQDPSPATPTDFRFITLKAQDQQTYHALGPGLEIEADSNQLGPFTLSPFISGQGHYFFGDLDVTLRDSNEFNESATWRFSRDRWQWVARLGVRLRWTP